MNELTPLASTETSLATPGQAPALITASGDQAETRFWEFFTVTIRNPNTRPAYARAAAEFCAFVEAGGVGDLRQMQPIHVPAMSKALQVEPDLG